MKIRKLVVAADIPECGESTVNCTISAQEDYTAAIDCIQNAINFLSHTVQCDRDDIVAKESIANLAVVLLDLKSAHSVTDAFEDPSANEIIADPAVQQ